MIRAFILFQLLLFSALGSGIKDEATAEEKLQLFLNERYALSIDRSRQFFAGKPSDVLVEIVALMKMWGDEVLCCCESLDSALFNESSEEWIIIKEKLETTFPDFHENLYLQEERYVMLILLKERSLEEDLKEYPDLLTDIKKFPQTLKELFENPVLRKLRLSQNEDGSWGDKERVYCTSLALLTCLSMGETPVSRTYGKMVVEALQYLQKVMVCKKRDLAIYTWCLAEAYGMTGVACLEDKLMEIIAEFEKSLLDPQEFESAPNRFYIESLCMKALYCTGIEYEGMFRQYKINLRNLAEEGAGYYQVFATLKPWGLSYSFDFSAYQQNLGDNVKMDSPYDELCYLSTSFQVGGKACRIARKQWTNKMESLQKGDAYYQYERNFSREEKELMQLVWPMFIECYAFPWRYLPSSRKFFNKTEKGNTVEVEGLDLIE